MHETRQVWPIAGIVACLLALIAATWWWQPTEAVPSWSGGPPSTSVGGMLAPAVDAQPQPEGESAEGPVMSPPTVTRSAVAIARRPASSQRRATGLSDSAAALRHARPAPPVADRIAADPALAELPSLPSLEPSLRAESTSRSNASPSRTPERSAINPAASRLSRQSVQTAPDIATCWPYPARLVESLDPLAAAPTTSQWSDRLRAQLDALHATQALSDPQAGAILEQLQRLTHEGMAIASRLSDLNQQAATMRVAYALQRRLAIWQPVHQLALPKVTQVSLRDRDSSELTRKLQAVDGQLARLPNTQAWRGYLMLDQLMAIASQHWSTSSTERSKLAREFLRRLETANATRQQEAFFSHSDWQEFAQEMRKWVCEPVDYEVLLDDVERVEAEGGENATRELAGHYQILRWSSSTQIEGLAARINTYYRNANVRVAISGELLNRLLPHPPSVNEQVNDQLVGGRVHGRSRVSTRLRLVLLPDRDRWRMGLEARGNVDSKTQTQRGPARFHNAGRSRYLARKLLLIDQRGVHTQDAEAAATSNADLTHLETDVDGVPLVNLLVRSIAKQQYDRQANAAVSEAEGLLANRAESRLDKEVDQTLRNATNKFRNQIWKPLQDLDLDPEAVDMQTTEERLIARYRLASSEQVGAFTPRPQAPSTSLLSIQVHESVLNNVVASLNLGGREVGLRDLFVEVATKLQREGFQVSEDVPDDVTIKLADQDPIRFECVNDRINLTLRIATLTRGNGRTWRDFQVRGTYLPKIQGIHVGLQRDADRDSPDYYIRLKGSKRKLSTMDTIALRTIFTSVLIRRPDVDLLGNVLANDKRLHDLRVCQFVIRDGWIGIAVGAGEPVRLHIAEGAGEPVRLRIADNPQ